MAEYIDRENLLEELKESAKHHADNSREESLLYRDRVIVREQPTADVIERDKIDKAIEEIRSEIKSIDYSLSVLDKSDSAKYEISAAKDGMTKAIDIFTKHMGEEE